MSPLFSDALRAAMAVSPQPPEAEPKPAKRAKRTRKPMGARMDALLAGAEFTHAAFRASIEGVHEQMGHLTVEQICEPPREWLDAALARQIAIHLTVNRFAVQKRRIAIELERSREAINRALRTVDERLAHDAFADRYEAMAERAQAALEASEGGDEGDEE